MSEPRKNHLNIDGGQVKDDEHVATYKPIPESDTVPDFRTSKSSLSKSKEKVSADGAEEKLLQKEDEAKVVTRVDMADAMYVVGDHRNGDAKIELDANKRQFTGLTKEELMKYANDPFWVRLRWFMFVLFWAMWLCMLAGAIAIIVRAPTCAPPPPRTWYEKGPLVDVSAEEDYKAVEEALPLMQDTHVAGVFAFACKETYEVLDDPSCLEQFKSFAAKAKEYGVKVIVDLTANFVSKTHTWFQLSENRSAEFEDYFTWAPGKDYNSEKAAPEPNPPNNWVSMSNTPAWTWSPKRREFYLHQTDSEHPDLKMSNPAVVKRFDAVIKLWMQAGADGIRLVNAHELIVNSTLPDEKPATGGGAIGADHKQYAFWQHQHTRDQPALHALLAHWAHLVRNATGTPAADTVFTLAERAGSLGRVQQFPGVLRPPSSAPLSAHDAAAAAAALNARLAAWPALQLTYDGPADEELASFALLLPATPVLDIEQLRAIENTTSPSKSFAHLVTLREDASVQHGESHVAAVPTDNADQQMLVCVRWKPEHMGYAGVYNPGSEAARANLTSLSALPPQLTVHRLSQAAQRASNHTYNSLVASDDVFVPAKSTVILSYAPKKAVEN